MRQRQRLSLLAAKGICEGEFRCIKKIFLNVLTTSADDVIIILTTAVDVIQEEDLSYGNFQIRFKPRVQ